MKNTPIMLSAAGSDRATAYVMSRKLVRQGPRLFVTWLDAPAEPKAPTTIMFAVCDAESGEPLGSFPIGTGIDNHCGAALAIDPEGRLHAVIGAHSGRLSHRYSDAPEDLGAWSAPEPFGPRDTYPSLVVDRDGTLHLAHREGHWRADEERWQVWYRRKRPGRGWEAPRGLVISMYPGYNHFMQTLNVGPAGTLHLSLQFHYTETGDQKDCKGRAAACLHSPDGGDSWYSESAPIENLPATVDDLALVCRHSHGVSISNAVTDADDQPWFLCSEPGRAAGTLWRRAPGGWENTDLGAVFGQGFHTYTRNACMTRDAAGSLHLVIPGRPDGQETSWGDPGLELWYVKTDHTGRCLGRRQITPPFPEAAHWLPSLESWDWCRPEASPIDRPWLLYTQGLNAGGFGNNVNMCRTKVLLTRLPA
ncbi:BNR-4 repeat-containing protein [Verrucomicrobiota bacterium]